MPQALIYATQLLGMLPALMAAGRDITTLVQMGNAALKSMQDERRNPTPEEWDALNTRIKDLQQALHAQD